MNRDDIYIKRRITGVHSVVMKGDIFTMKTLCERLIESNVFGKQMGFSRSSVLACFVDRYMRDYFKKCKRINKHKPHEYEAIK